MVRKEKTLQNWILFLVMPILDLPLHNIQEISIIYDMILKNKSYQYNNILNIYI